MLSLRIVYVESPTDEALLNAKSCWGRWARVHDLFGLMGETGVPVISRLGHLVPVPGYVSVVNDNRSV